MTTSLRRFELDEIHNTGREFGAWVICGGQLVFHGLKWFVGECELLGGLNHLCIIAPWWTEPPVYHSMLFEQGSELPDNNVLVVDYLL